MTTPHFTLLVPVKDGGGAKTRLGEVGAAGRADLMAAFARDAIRAAKGTGLVEVVVVGDPEALAPVLAGLDVVVVPDEGAGDLNRALAAAAARVARPDRGVAVMLADLPCLRTADLEWALVEALAHGGRAFVADAAGTGTTLLAAPPGVDLDPRFGRESAHAHAAGGAVPLGAGPLGAGPLGAGPLGAGPLSGGLESLRLDVDTTEDLAAALRLGAGPETTRVAATLVARGQD